MRSHARSHVALGSRDGSPHRRGQRRTIAAFAFVAVLCIGWSPHAHAAEEKVLDSPCAIAVIGLQDLADAGQIDPNAITNQFGFPVSDAAAESAISINRIAGTRVPRSFLGSWTFPRGASSIGCFGEAIAVEVLAAGDDAFFANAEFVDVFSVHIDRSLGNGFFEELTIGWEINPATGFAPSPEAPAFLAGLDFAYGYNSLDGFTRTVFFQPDENGASTEFQNPLPTVIVTHADGSQSVIVASPISGTPTVATSASSAPSFEDVGTVVFEADEWMGASFDDDPAADDWVTLSSEALALLAEASQAAENDPATGPFLEGFVFSTPVDDAPADAGETAIGDDGQLDDETDLGEPDEDAVDSDAPESAEPAEEEEPPSGDTDTDTGSDAEVQPVDEQAAPPDAGDVDDQVQPPADAASDDDPDSAQSAADEPVTAQPDPASTSTETTSSNRTSVWFLVIGVLLLGAVGAAILLLIFFPTLRAWVPRRRETLGSETNENPADATAAESVATEPEVLAAYTDLVEEIIFEAEANGIESVDGQMIVPIPIVRKVMSQAADEWDHASLEHDWESGPFRELTAFGSAAGAGILEVPEPKQTSAGPQLDVRRLDSVTIDTESLRVYPTDGPTMMVDDVVVS